MQRERRPQQEVLLDRDFWQIVCAEDERQQTHKNSQHANEGTLNPVLCKEKRPSNLEQAGTVPPRRHCLNHFACAQRGEHLCHCKNAFPNENGPPNGKGIPRRSDKCLILLTQLFIGGAESPSQGAIGDADIGQVRQHVDP